MRVIDVLAVLVVFSGICLAQETNFAAGPQYLSLTGTTMLRSIATPSYSLETPLPPIPELPQVGPPVANQPYVSNPVVEHQTDLFPIYYGYPENSVVELANTEAAPEIPFSVTGGLSHFVDVQTIREMGYRESVAADAAYWKAHAAPITRLYTNADIEKLPRN